MMRDVNHLGDKRWWKLNIFARNLNNFLVNSQVVGIVVCLLLIISTDIDRNCLYACWCLLYAIIRRICIALSVEFWLRSCFTWEEREEKVRLGVVVPLLLNKSAYSLSGFWSSGRSSDRAQKSPGSTRHDVRPEKFWAFEFLHYFDGLICQRSGNKVASTSYQKLVLLSLKK